MPDQDFDLPSGIGFHVSIAPFQDAKALSKALIKSLGGVQLSADILNMDVTVLKDAFVNAATSDEVESYLFKCFERTTYNGLKVTKDLFDDPKIGEQARKDYILMCAKVIQVNCLPFFDQALSTLKTIMEKKAEPQK